MKIRAHISGAKPPRHLLSICLFCFFAARTYADNVEVGWVQRYTSYITNGTEQAYKVVSDTNGDIIVVGTADEGTTYADLLILKYSSNGELLWTNRCNGPANSTDSPESVTVDSSGNIFVTGFTQNLTNSGTVFLTVAYSSAGTALWTNYHGGGFAGVTDDRAKGVAVDDQGRVFVTGTAGNAFTTLAYSTAGDALWTNRLNGSGMAVAVDQEGNVFVTGSDGANFATIKYSNTGTPLWTNRYNGPTNATDAAQALAISPNGDVIVTGISPGYGTSDDFATIKYSNAGATLWTQRYAGSGSSYDRPQAVTVDREGNVLVTGSSESGSSGYYTTIKYSSDGVPLWTNRQYRAGNFTAGAHSIATDSANNVIISGYPSTLKYSSAGGFLWMNNFTGYNARGMTVDASDNIIVAGLSTVPGYDALTIKYAPEGGTLWQRSYNGLRNGYDTARTVAVDGGGNVFVTGYSTGQTSGNDFATVKYSPTGLPLWTNACNGTGNANDEPVAMAVNQFGLVFVTGVSAGGSSDFATVAYANDGHPLWTNRFNGNPALGSLAADMPQAIATDDAGNVIVTGYSFQSYAGNTYVTIAYSSAGAPLWTNYYKFSANSDDYAKAMTVARNGHAFVTGFSYSLPGFADYVTIAYSSTGVPLWTNRFKGSPTTYDYAQAVAADPNGNVIVTGISGSDLATVKYSGDGTPLWTNFFGASGGSYEFAQAVRTDSNGDVFVLGYSGTDNRGRSADYITIKYSSDGRPLWTNAYSETATSSDRAIGMAVDEFGHVFVTGSSATTTGDNAVTIGYASTGEALWTNRYYRTTAQALAAGGNGKLFLLGTARTSGSSDFVTLKYLYHSPPEITTQPVGRTNNVGTMVMFNVTAEGNAPLSYLWRKDGVNLTDGNNVIGAMTPNLTLAQITTNDAGIYSVLITNAYGQALGSNAVLRVNQFPHADASATVSVVISCNSSNAPISLDGSRSSDPDGDPLGFTWHRDSAATALATGPVALVTLPVGTNTLVLAVDDGLAQDQLAFTVEVIPTIEAVARLEARVRAEVRQPQPLLASLSAALASLERGKPIAAVLQLRVFQIKVRVQVAPRDPALAMDLIRDAERIIDALKRCGHDAQGHFMRFERQNHGRIWMQFVATPGAVHFVEASTDMMDWETIGPATDCGDGVFEFVDPSTAQQPMRFYRIVSP